VIEHVADPAEFCQSLAALTIPNGAIVISTINRTMRAYAAAIVGAEYILRWVGLLPIARLLLVIHLLLSLGLLPLSLHVSVKFMLR